MFMDPSKVCQQRPTHCASLLQAPSFTFLKMHWPLLTIARSPQKPFELLASPSSVPTQTRPHIWAFDAPPTITSGLAHW